MGERGDEPDFETYISEFDLKDLADKLEDHLDIPEMPVIRHGKDGEDGDDGLTGPPGPPGLRGPPGRDVSIELIPMRRVRVVRSVALSSTKSSANNRKSKNKMASPQRKQKNFSDYDGEYEGLWGQDYDSQTEAPSLSGGSDFSLFVSQSFVNFAWETYLIWDISAIICHLFAFASNRYATYLSEIILACKKIHSKHRSNFCFHLF